jgi:glycosidase
MTKFFVLIICFLSATATFAQTEVIYHIHQRSFFDSDANGNGDMEGVRQKLDYLQGLGITTIQLSPIYQADLKKSTNDTNFEKVAIEYGKFINYRNLVQDLHRRKMKLYLEVEPGYLQTIAAQDANPKIKESLTQALKYWADPNTDGKFYDGADGFVILAMADKPLAANKNLNLLKDFWAPIINDVKKVNPALQIIAEPDNKNTVGNRYFSKAGADVAVASKLQRAVKAFSKKDIVAAADSTFNYLPAGKQAIVFLEDASAKRFASQLAGDIKKLKVGAALNLLIGGIPSIYYGQELGMKSSAELPEAFEWYAADSGTGMAVWYKDSPLWDSRAAKANDGLSLEEEQKDANSLFSYYKLLFKLKAQENALSGTYNNLANDNDNVLSFTRTSDKGTVLVVINLSATQEQVMLENDGKLRVDQVKLLLGAADVKFARGGRSLALPPYAIQVWKVLN